MAGHDRTLRSEPSAEFRGSPSPFSPNPVSCVLNSYGVPEAGSPRHRDGRPIGRRIADLLRRPRVGLVYRWDSDGVMSGLSNLRAGPRGLSILREPPPLLGR
jgi:hypothetical protein